MTKYLLTSLGSVMILQINDMSYIAMNNRDMK